MFVVTGGGSGIGQALAQALAMRQKSVLIVGRHEASLCETAKFSSLIDYVCADVSTNTGRKEIVSHLKNVATIDGLIHNAGVIEPIVPMADMDEGSWDQVLSTNLNAPLFLSQLLLNKLVGGRVLHMGSGAAYLPIVGWSAYCVSKAALSMLTSCWQLETDAVAFASVMPGIIDTPMQEKIRASSHMESEKIDFFQQLKEKHQLLLPETVGLFLTWLLLDIDKKDYVSQEWDIYDKTHHDAWVKPPHVVWPLE